MKQSILVVAVMLCASTLWAQSSKNLVTIKGVISGDLKGYSKMYLYTRTSRDSAEIRNGEYSFTFPFTEAAMQMLYPEYTKSQNKPYQPFGILVSEPGSYTVHSDIATGMFVSSVVTGPKPAVLYRSFEKKQKEALQKMANDMEKLYGKNWYRIDEQDTNYQAIQHCKDSVRDIHMVPILEALVRNHPNSYASAFALAGSGRQIGSTATMEKLYTMLSAGMKKTDAGKIFGDYLQGLKHSRIGSTIANFVLPDTLGSPVAFQSFKGKYVLIDFWASWCGPCRKSFPHMRAVYEKYQSNPFEIYSISIDKDKKAWMKAVQEEANPWPQSLDTENISQKIFAVTGVPSTFLIDPSGKIIAKEVGFDPNGGSEIEKKINTIFGSTNNNSKTAGNTKVKTMESLSKTNN